MWNSQVPRSTQYESYCVELQNVRASNLPAIYNKSVQCCVFHQQDPSMWTTAQTLCFWEINRTSFNWKDVCWGMSQEIPGVLDDTDIKHHELIHSQHCYSQYRDSQNVDFALFQSIQHTNLDTNDAACVHLVHILHHPTSQQSRK